MQNNIHREFTHGLINKWTVDSLIALVDQYDDIDSQDTNGSTVLAVAAIGGRIDVVLALLRRGANVNAGSRSGSTALILAAEKGDVPIVLALIQAGADVNSRDKTGMTALMSAAWQNRIDVIRLLLTSGADVHATSDDGHTAAEYATGTIAPKSVQDYFDVLHRLGRIPETPTQVQARVRTEDAADRPRIVALLESHLAGNAEITKER